VNLTANAFARLKSSSCGICADFLCERSKNINAQHRHFFHADKVHLSRAGTAELAKMIKSNLNEHLGLKHIVFALFLLIIIIITSPRHRVCTLVTMATAAILNFFNPQKLPHTTVDIFVKFGERNPKISKIPPFWFPWQLVAKFIQPIPRNRDPFET
jgi:hypothetical protein